MFKIILSGFFIFFYIFSEAQITSPNDLKPNAEKEKKRRERDEAIFEKLYTKEALKFRINSDFPEFVHSGEEKKYMQSILQTLYHYDPSTYDYRSEPAKPMTFVRVRGEEEKKISPFEYFYDEQVEKNNYKLDHRSLRIERKRINNRE